MKKFYLMMLFGAMFATSASAQATENGYVLDSTYTTNASDARMSKEVFEYNDTQQPTASYSYTYYDQTGALTSTAAPSGKTLTTYDDQGRPTKEEDYVYENNDWTKTSLMEYSEFNAEGNPTVIVIYELDDENPAAGLQPSVKYVVTKYNGKEMEDANMYMNEGGEWLNVGTYHNDFNDWGGVTKTTTIYNMMGYQFSTESTYEYDSEHRLVKETSQDMMGGLNITTYEWDSHGYSTKETYTIAEGGNHVSTFVNEYDGNGNIAKRAETPDYGEKTTEYYFWSKNGATGISSLRLNDQLKGIYYDLNGRRMNGTPTQKGVYILDGKKTLVK